MPQQIAGLYEIHRKIGSGGGGIVYLGWHVRLKTQIVLKADKRSLDTAPQKLRREVDMLKKLKNTYIPQVYDFVEEDGVVYTVMDFIEGESLDKILQRGEKPSQPQVIQWACQLLEALVYLHEQSPHGILHGDIKPANIMLRPGGDICLIDFNIALVLGENGAVKVGRSRGYASPEHYGIGYAPTQPTEKRKKKHPKGRRRRRYKENGSDDTEIMEETETMTETQSMEEHGPFLSKMSSSTGGQNQVTLDARSDIYSLGATLYHLLSGKRPEQDALIVEPLGKEFCSPQVSKIIQKAMAPSAAMRYLSAKEMLDAFRGLYKNDPRVIRHRRWSFVSAAFFSLLFLAGGGCTFIGLKQMEQVQEMFALAEYSANSLAQGDVFDAVELALQAFPEEKQIFSVPAAAPVQKALTDALGVYDLSDGFKVVDSIKLPSAPFALTASPKGSRFAAVYAYEAAVYDRESGRCLAVLLLEKSALSDVKFLNENRLLYAGADGVSAYDLEKKKTLWTGERATSLALSGDGQIAAAVNRNEDFAVLYQTDNGEKIGKCSFDGQHLPIAENDIFAHPGDFVFALNHDGSRLAVSFDGGGLTVFDWKNRDNDLILYGKDSSKNTGFAGGFCGSYFAFAANREEKSLFGIVDAKNALYLGGHESQTPYCLQVSEKGIALANGNLLVSFDPKTLEEKELAYTDKENITAFSFDGNYALVATDGPGFALFDRGAKRILSESSQMGYDFPVLAGPFVVLGNRNEPFLRMLKRESHEEAVFLSYDARYDHDEARVSQDGKTVVLFSNRSFRVYDLQENLLTEVILPDAEQIYDQQFRRAGEDSWLEVIWYDGTVRCYRAADGTLLSEVEGVPPDRDLEEEFYTDRYRIHSSLHGAPEVYDRETDRKIGILEEDAYLTYVTQVGEWVVTEYINTEGKRYGLLLDKDLQVIACMPGLCDIVGETLIFDDKSGNLRQCRLYSLQELKELGEAYRRENAEKGKERKGE